MADLVPDLSKALSSLQAIELNADVPVEYREPVFDLTQQLRVRIHDCKVYGQHDVDEAIVPEIKEHVGQIREAAVDLNFDQLLEHGFAMMDALPGPRQSLPKRPRRP